MKKFRFSLNLEVDLTPGEVWPDDEPPENPTLKDVLEVLSEDYCVDKRRASVYTSGDVMRILEEWGLIENDAVIKVSEIDDGEEE